MKKKVLFIAAITVGFLTTTEAEAQDFKASAGHHNIEVNFAPLGGNPISINSIKYRNFIADDMAFRLGFSVSSASTKTPVVFNNSAGNEITAEDKSSSFGIALSPGIEKHFEGTDRLSPYIGAVINFAMVSDKDETNHWDFGNDNSFAQELTGGSTTFGLNLVLGADWYFAKHLYMGTEIGFGFSTTSLKDSELTNATGPGSATVKTENGGSFNLGPNFQSSIRLGFLF